MPQWQVLADCNFKGDKGLIIINIIIIIIIIEGFSSYYCHYYIYCSTYHHHSGPIQAGLVVASGRVPTRQALSLF